MWGFFKDVKGWLLDTEPRSKTETIKKRAATLAAEAPLKGCGIICSCGQECLNSVGFLGSAFLFGLTFISGDSDVRLAGVTGMAGFGANSVWGICNKMGYLTGEITHCAVEDCASQPTPISNNDRQSITKESAYSAVGLGPKLLSATSETLKTSLNFFGFFGFGAIYFIGLGAGSDDVQAMGIAGMVATGSNFLISAATNTVYGLGECANRMTRDYLTQRTRLQIQDGRGRTEDTDESQLWRSTSIPRDIQPENDSSCTIL